MKNLPETTCAVAFSLAGALLLLSGPLSAEDLSADQIVEKALRFARAERDAGIKYGYRRLATRQELDRFGRPEKTSDLVYRSALIDGQVFERLVTIDGKPPVGEDLQKEKDREAEFRKQIAEKKEDETQLDRKLADRYRFVLVGEEVVGGRPSYRLRFAPAKGKDLPSDEPEDAILNALAGEVWIDTGDFAVARIRARLTRTVRIGLGLLATMKKANIAFDVRKADSGKWLPVSMKFYLWGHTMLFKPIRQRETSRFEDIRPMKAP